MNGSRRERRSTQVRDADGASRAPTVTTDRSRCHLTVLVDAGRRPSGDQGDAALRSATQSPRAERRSVRLLPCFRSRRRRPSTATVNRPDGTPIAMPRGTNIGQRMQWWRAGQYRGVPHDQRPVDIMCRSGAVSTGDDGRRRGAVFTCPHDGRYTAATLLLTEKVHPG